MHFWLKRLVHHMGSSSANKGSLTFKIDLEKANDSVSWSFLKETLHLFWFPKKLIELIMQCVSDPISLSWGMDPGFHHSISGWVSVGIRCLPTCLS